MNPIIETRNLKLRYSENKPYILNSINMDIERNSITAIAGLSGCGKSTLAFALTGIIPKSLPGILEGEIIVNGKDIQTLTLPRLSKEIGIVFQEVDNQLFLPTVEAEIAFALENLCLPYEKIDETINRVLKYLDIEHLRYKDPSSLSGGEKRLIAIAEVLSRDPEIMLFDEIMSSLDEKNKSMIMDTIDLLKTSGKTIIFIDHDIENLMIADYIYLMKEGRIEHKVKGGIDDGLLYNRLTDFFLPQIRNDY